MVKELMGVEGVDYVVCQICGKRFKGLGKHITRTHKITKERYIELYPNSNIISDSNHNSHARVAKVQWESEDGRKKKLDGINTSWTKERRDHRSIERKLYFSNHPEVRKDISDRMIDNNPMLQLEYREKVSVAAKDRCKDPYYREMMRLDALQYYREHPEKIDELRERRLHQKMPTDGTSIELKMREILEYNNYNFENNIPILNICIPDIVFKDKKIIIQCDGDYWHNYPNGLERDRKQDKILKDNGWSVLRFWEHEINNDIEGCIEKFKLEYYGDDINGE